MLSHQIFTFATYPLRVSVLSNIYLSSDSPRLAFAFLPLSYSAQLPFAQNVPSWVLLVSLYNLPSSRPALSFTPLSAKLRRLTFPSSSLHSQVYCSQECESLDAASPSITSLTSPSLSAVSSAYPSPYLASTHGVGDVPALVPSVLGHRAHHSISSSSNSSTGWSALTEEELEASVAITLNTADATEMMHVLGEGAKSPQHLHPHGNGLSFMRRPSTTNHRSTVPMLLRQGSGMTSTTTASSSSGASRGMPSPLYTSVVTDDRDDTSSLCLSDSTPSDIDAHQHISVSAGLSSSMKKKRNRASLPAYFSLLQGRDASATSTAANTATNSPTSPRHWRTPSALQQISRSLHASPTTPKVAYATATFTHAGLSGVPATESTPATYSLARDERERGRGRPRTRDPEVRSASSRREIARSPVRHDRAYQLHDDKENDRRGLSAAQRARIDSVEKVAEWVSSSPVMRGYAAQPQQHLPMERRNSSPRRNEMKETRERVRHEFVEALTRGLRGCAVADDDEESLSEEVNEKLSIAERERDVRGRRRAHELDLPLSEAAPGLGSGRSGLKAREERLRAREERERSERGRSGRW